MEESLSSNLFSFAQGNVLRGSQKLSKKFALKRCSKYILKAEKVWLCHKSQKEKYNKQQNKTLLTDNPNLINVVITSVFPDYIRPWGNAGSSWFGSRGHPPPPQDALLFQGAFPVHLPIADFKTQIPSTWMPVLSRKQEEGPVYKWGGGFYWFIFCIYFLSIKTRKRFCVELKMNEFTAVWAPLWQDA